MGPMPEVHRHIVTLPRGPWVHPMEGGSPQGSSKLTPECVAFGGSRLHPDTATLQQLIGVLQRELDAAHAREQAAQEREALLLQMLQQVQQQSQRLLEAGPPAPVSSHPAPVAVSHRDRGDMRQRIVALLARLSGWPVPSADPATAWHPERLRVDHEGHAAGWVTEARSTRTVYGR